MDHNFLSFNFCFGTEMLRCSRCNGIKLDSKYGKDNNIYCGDDSWMAVSKNCNVAFKQIELIQKSRGLL